MGILIKKVSPESSADVSQYCKFFFRCEQSTGNMENKAQNGLLGVKNSGFSDGTLWANAGYATVGGTVGNYCTLNSAAHDFSLATHSLIFTLRIKKAVATKPAAEQYIISSYNPGGTTGGIIISARTDGSLRLYFNAVDGSSANLGTAADVLTDGATSTEKSYVWMAPRESGTSLQLGVNALAVATASASSLFGKSYVGNRDMRIGQGQLTGAIDVYHIAAFGCYAVPVNLSTIDQRQVYDWAMRNSSQPMPDWVFA